MIILTYIVTIILFCVGAMFSSLLLFPLISVYIVITKSTVTAKHPIHAICNGVGAFLLMLLTQMIWQKFGLRVSWLLAGILIVIHLLFSKAQGSDANKPQELGIAVGVTAWLIVDLL